MSQVAVLHWQPIRQSAQRSESMQRPYVLAEAPSVHVGPCWQPASVVAASRVKNPMAWRVPMPDFTAKGCGWVHRMAQFACRADRPSSSTPPLSRDFRSTPRFLLADRRPGPFGTSNVDGNCRAVAPNFGPPTVHLLTPNLTPRAPLAAQLQRCHDTCKQLLTSANSY